MVCTVQSPRDRVEFNIALEIPLPQAGWTRGRAEAHDCGTSCGRRRHEAIVTSLLPIPELPASWLLVWKPTWPVRVSGAGQEQIDFSVDWPDWGTAGAPRPQRRG
jgi:hypothetical protein